MSAALIQQRILEQLQLEAAQPVDIAAACFSSVPPPPTNQFVSLCASKPTVFTSLDTFDHSYTLFLTLPIPNPSQLSEIRDSISQASSQSPASPGQSLRITHSNGQTYVPLWIIQIWPHLHALIRHCLAWANATSTLSMLAGSSDRVGSLASELLERIPTIPLDSSTPNSILQHFRTSHLPVLIQDKWLSDDHIDASAELVNWHPERKQGVRALNSHFINYLRRQFDRSPTYPALHLTSLDRLIIGSSINELLVPVHLPSHWVLLYVNIDLRSYSYTDTLDLADTVAPPATINLVNRWLSGLLGLTISLTPLPRPFGVGAQLDSSSCGVAVMSTMAHYALGGSHQAWTQSSTIEHRLAWAICLSSPVDELDLPVFETFLEDLDDESNPGAPCQGVCKPICTSSTADSSDSEPEVLPQQSPPPRAKLRQTTLPFKSIPYSEWRIQEKRRHADRLAEREDEASRIAHLELRKRLERREWERDRKRAQRARQKRARKAAKEANRRDADMQQIAIVLPLLPDARQTVSSLSRPYSVINAAVSRQNLNKPSKRQTPLNPTRRINWCHEIYWSLIEASAQAVGYPWSPVEIVNRLKLIDHDTFQYLRPQRISQWRDHQYPNELRWTEAHLRAIKAGNRPITSTGRQGVFHNRPDVVEIIKNCLLDLRKTGVSLNLKLIRGYMMGIIKHYMPEAFSVVTRSGRLFCCSERFVRQFLREELGWSVRKSTRAAQKYPPNVDTVLLEAFLRMACAVRDYSIPDCCIVNADQTQVVYSSGDHKTWTATGERQISVLGTEEKRAFTLLVAAALSGDLLPFQAIYAGKSDRSVPGKDCPGWSEAHRLGFLLEYSNTTTYWSTFETMCNWVTKVLAPYFESQRAKHGLPADQRCILQLDCWSVHRSTHFRDWMKENHPSILLMYVPGGCTGLFQACDVGIQRVLKIAIRNAAHADVVTETVNALQSGIKPERVVNDQSLPTLRRRSLNWIIQAYHAINRSDLIKKAFLLCAVPDTPHNLSYESLVSATARQAIVALSRTNPALYMELLSSAYSTAPVGPAEADSNVEWPAEGADGDVDDDLNPTVDEVCRRVLDATSAGDAAQPITACADGPESEGFEDAASAPPERAATVARLDRAIRRSLRLSGKARPT
ncbi:hypothetical protein FRC07_001460 [Ceratobasidium sp. 392]|nr:hypothetical protein FRC07_001460 [Ceratobasidium sp. 392]